MTDASRWDPDVYERFKKERRQPFEDLLTLVRPRDGMRVVDLGCGTGELTSVLHGALSAKETLGVDSSAEMLERSAVHAKPGLTFLRADLATFTPGEAGGAGTADLVFSNAALHWVDDHEALFARLVGALAAGGQLAVQVPAQESHPSHVTAANVAREEPFRSALGGYARVSPVLRPEEYAALLFRLGLPDQHVRLQIYGHVLPSREDVVEWVKGSLLTDYRRRLSVELYALFLERYAALLLERLPDERPFFYPYRRVLIWGRKP